MLIFWYFLNFPRHLQYTTRDVRSAKNKKYFSLSSRAALGAAVFGQRREMQYPFVPLQHFLVTETLTVGHPLRHHALDKEKQSKSSRKCESNHPLVIMSCWDDLAARRTRLVARGMGTLFFPFTLKQQARQSGKCGLVVAAGGVELCVRLGGGHLTHLIALSAFICDAFIWLTTPAFNFFNHGVDLLRGWDDGQYGVRHGLREGRDLLGKR